MPKYLKEGLERGGRAETKQTVNGVCLFVGGYALLSLTTQSLVCTLHFFAERRYHHSAQET